MKRFIAILLIFFLGCAHGPGRSGRGPQVNGTGLSGAIEREAKIGRQIHQQITSTFRMYTEPRLVGYVTRIGRSVARESDRQELPYLFTVLYDDRVYATDAPGGFVYITTGFLNFLQNEAELAAVLAHEIAELQFRDPKLSISRRAIGTLAQTGAVAAPFFGQFGVLIAGALVLLNAVNESTIPSMDKRVERADRKALHYLLEAGHDPQGYLDLLGRLSSPGPEWLPYLYDYSLSRPITMKRYEAAMAEFEKLPLKEKSFSVHRERFLEMTKGVREIYQR